MPCMGGTGFYWDVPKILKAIAHNTLSGGLVSLYCCRPVLPQVFALLKDASLLQRKTAVFRRIPHNAPLHFTMKGGVNSNVCSSHRKQII